jgi:hypothetical protein
VLCRAAALDRLNINAVPIGGGSRTLAAALAPLRRLAEVVTELTLGVNDGVADPLAVAIIAPMHGPVVKQSLVELLSRWAALAERATSKGKAEPAVDLGGLLLLLLLLGLSSVSLLRLFSAAPCGAQVCRLDDAAGAGCGAVVRGCAICLCLWQHGRAGAGHQPRHHQGGRCAHLLLCNWCAAVVTHACACRKCSDGSSSTC